MSDASDDGSSCSGAQTTKKGGSEVTRAEEFTAVATIRVPQPTLDNGEGKKATDEDRPNKEGRQWNTRRRRTQRGRNERNQNKVGQLADKEPRHGGNDVSSEVCHMPIRGCTRQRGRVPGQEEAASGSEEATRRWGGHARRNRRVAQCRGGGMGGAYGLPTRR